MAQLCARAIYATRPSFHFNSGISGSDGGATVPPSGTPGIDRVMGNDGTVLHRAGYEAGHAVVTVGVRRSQKLEDLRGAGPRPSARSPSGVSRRTTFRDAVRERRRTEAATGASLTEDGNVEDQRAGRAESIGGNRADSRGASQIDPKRSLVPSHAIRHPLI
jgi:hypothetical protein